MTKEELLEKALPEWLSGGGAEEDIVLASRVRLARNLCKLPFPNRAKAQELAQVRQTMRSLAQELEEDGDSYTAIDMEDLTPLERYILVEKHIISPQLAREPQQRALIVDARAGVCIMVNEEDHIRVQALRPGLDLLGALAAADVVDDLIESRHDLAFLPEFGYLTACPTNVGTGMRASVMLHLPALAMTKQIEQVIQAVTQLGLTVRGMYGEGSEAAGNIFQISNQLTLGLSEKEVIGNIEGVVRQVVDHERDARRMLKKDAPLELSDRIWRAFGVLRYARRLGGSESLALLSQIRLGADEGIIEDISPLIFNELIVATRPAFLQRLSGKIKLSPEERRSVRAELVRGFLKRGV